MKLAVDPRMVRNLPFEKALRSVARAGYRYVEWSPRDDFLPSYKGRRASTDAVRTLRSAAISTGVEIISLWVNYRWTSVDDDERSTAVRYWKEAFRTAVELGCPQINTEFKGDPNRPELAEGAFWRSMDELLPIVESEGLRLAIEPHPGDFVESGYEAVDIIRGVRSPAVKYLFCAPHTFIMGGGGEIGSLVRYASEVLGYVHLADTLRPARIIVDPHDAPVRVHQHLDIDQGELDWTQLFNTLREIGYDDTVTVSVFAWPDRAEDSFRFNFERAGAYLKQAGYEIS